jgi:cytochrome P450
MNLLQVQSASRATVCTVCSGGMLVTISAEPHDHPITLDTTGETSPYPFFEYKRRTEPVYHGSLMDTDLLPPELKPDDAWVLFGYDGVFQAFRDDRIFTSASYDKTIGLVMGHTILAMGGKEHPYHRSLLVMPLLASALER